MLCTPSGAHCSEHTSTLHGSVPTPFNPVLLLHQAQWPKIRKYSSGLTASPARACTCRPSRFNYEDDAVVPALLDGPVAACVHARRMQAALQLLETCIERWGACYPCMHACWGVLRCPTSHTHKHVGLYCAAVHCSGQGSHWYCCQGISWIAGMWLIRTYMWAPATAGQQFLLCCDVFSSLQAL